MCSFCRLDLGSVKLLVGNAPYARSQTLNLGADVVDLVSEMRLCGAVPVFDFLSCLTLGEAVALLDLSFELGAAPADGGQIVVGKLAPPLLGLAPQLLPVSFESIPIHVNLLALSNLLWARR